MATSSLPSCLKDQNLEEATKNIFVTQSRQRKDDSDKEFFLAPRLLDAGVTSIKETIVVRKRTELDEANIQLALKRQQFIGRMEDLAQRRTELEKLRQEDRERVIKLEKFVADNEVRRRKARKKCEATREENKLKQRAIEDLTQNLKKLRAIKEHLREKTVKNKIFEDFLMKTLDVLPSIYLKIEHEASVMTIIRRHETLATTHQELLQRLEHMEAEVEQNQQQLQGMKQEISTKKLMASKELSELQSELENLKEKNKQAEVKLLIEQGVSREKNEEVGRLRMAIYNLAHQCYLPAYGSLESMNPLTMLDMVKECILDKADTEQRVRKLMRSISAITSTTAVMDKKWRASMKSLESETHLKSSNKVSKKNETSNEWY